MRSTPFVILFLIVATFFSASGHTISAERKPFDSPQEKLSPEEIAAQIRKVAEELIGSGSRAVTRAEFSLDKEEKVINYGLGGAKTRLLGFDENDPYELPLGKTIQAELLRKQFLESVPNETFWKEPLSNIETLILETIRDIEATPDKEKLREKLAQRRKEIDQQLANLKGAIEEFASSLKFDVRRFERSLASASFLVEVSTEPPGGKVKLMEFAKYVRCSALKKCGSLWPWREIVSQATNLIGVYYYQVEWPNGIRGEGRIEVLNPLPLIFKPGN